MTKYVVSKDKENGLWYAHKENFAYIPVFGSFCEKKSEAREYAKMMMCLPNKVEEIEMRKKEQYNETIN